ncbi:MAG: AAA family ATPase [Hyphomicrobiales bacterium]|nr:AAA family ATPase [Hyphomicrobiales bacterium]
MPPKPLSPDDLTVSLGPATLTFMSTDDLPDLENIVGQDRALEAIAFGVGMRRAGYNIFLVGPEGTGRHSTISALVKKRAKKDPTPDDWVYVGNFDELHKPHALRLPPGRGVELAEAMSRFVEDIQETVPALFESEENQTRFQAIQDEFQQKQETAFEDLRQRAAEKNIALIRTPMGFGFAPTVNGQIIKPDVFEKLPDSERKRIESDIAALQADLQNIVKQLPGWDKARRESIRELRAEITAFAIGETIASVLEQFRDVPVLVDYLDAVRNDLINSFHTIMMAEQATAAAARDGHGADATVSANSGFVRYRVNPIVHNGERTGAPVIYEDNPTLANLVGRVEYGSRFGALVTDLSLIKAGALHRANGGYLILDARKLLTQPFAWAALKRALKAGRITIESPGQMLNLINTISLEPEPIPLRTKIAICGDRLVYYLLSELDPEFSDLFMVEADFSDDMDRSPETEADFAKLVGTLVKTEELRPFDTSGVVRVIKHAVRIAGDTRKISVHMRSIVDLLHEADHYAETDDAAMVTGDHVQRAIDAKIRRSDRLRERSEELIERGVVLINTDGTAVGQVNGLSVIQLGGFAFGRPTRITARVRLGAGKVIDIEREVELGGPLHSKGVLILAGFLAARYAIDAPLSLSATLVFEQSYGGIEGDSASAAELFALLSALADVGVRQELAVTGSVNQKGQIQAIGGVNEKIEGFFDICSIRGLTGSQGVLIPKANVQHLVLRQDVVDAAADGQFHIYPMESIDDGMELLTGLAAGEVGDSGQFPPDTINHMVEQRLLHFAKRRRAFGQSADSKERSGS